VQGEVFVKINGNGIDIYDRVKNSMFSNSEVKVIKEASVKTSGGIGLAIPMIGITFVIAILVMKRYIEKKRRKWKNHDVDTYAYE
jgi:predicted transporter